MTMMLKPALLKATVEATSAYSGQADHSFRAIPIADSGQGDHPGRDAAGQLYFAPFCFLVKSPRCFRMDSPASFT